MMFILEYTCSGMFHCASVSHWRKLYHSSCTELCSPIYRIACTGTAAALCRVSQPCTHLLLLPHGPCTICCHRIDCPPQRLRVPGSHWVVCVLVCRSEAWFCRNSKSVCLQPWNVVQVAELEKSKTAVEHDMASVAARIARAQAANAALMSSKSSSVAGAGSRGGRKSGRAAAAAAATTFAPEVVPLPIASAPVIPAHFVPYTFHYPGREPFMVRQLCTLVLVLCLRAQDRDARSVAGTCVQA